MDTAAIYQIISVVGFSLAGILFITAVFMFIKLKIPSIYGDLTGRTAMKQIQAIREHNAASGNKSFRSSHVNVQRGKLTEPVVRSDKLSKTNKVNDFTKYQNNKMAKNIGVIENMKSVSTLTDIQEINTIKLSGETQLLQEDTEVLINPELPSPETKLLEMPSDHSNQFKIIKDIIFINTEEVIE